MWPSEVGDELVVTIITQGNDEHSPLKKKQKQKKQLWTEKTMSEALDCCKNGELGVEEASLIYGIPKRSLRLRLNKNFSLIDDKYRVFLLPVFPLQAELELVEHLQGLIQSQFTFTSVEVRRLAYELISEKYNLDNLPQEKDCLLGNRWYKTLITKYPLLESENIFESFHDKSSRFYNALETVITEHQIDSRRIFSVDCIELKFRASNAYDLDKIYHRRKIIYTDAKAICCISAAGEFVPPLFIKPEERGSNQILSLFIVHENENDFQTYTDDYAFKGDRSANEVRSNNNVMNWSQSRPSPLPTAEEVANIKNQIKVHLNKKLQSMSEENEEELREKLYEQFDKLRNKTISKHENGLNVISNEVFQEWFRNFVLYVRPSIQRKVILLVRDQNLVKCLKTLELAKTNGVIFLMMPPHSAHKIHPLDGFTMSLNRNLSTCASIWLGKNPDFKIQEVPLFELFKMAYKDTVNTSIAKNGFVYSGIWPVNRNIFQSTELGGESVLLKNRIQASSNNSEAGCSDMQSIFIKYGSPDGNKIIDISKLCRVCMKEKMYMKPLFDSRVPNYHGRKISEIIERPISPDDGLPGFICQYCLVQLMEMVKIKNITVESNKTMIKIRELLNGFFYNDDSEKILLSECQYQLPKQINPKLMEKFLAKNFEIDSICRICIGEKPLMTSIFYFPHSATNYYPDLSTRIMKVSNCQVSAEDGLSSSICAFCRTSINQAWEFIQKLLGSNKRFQEILTEQSDKIL